MPYWNPITVDGVQITLDHLEPFEFQIALPDSDAVATVSVHFHDHCFTEDFDPIRHKERLVTNQSSLVEIRAFCKLRYDLSLLLPTYIKELSEKKIASTRQGNFIRLETPEGYSYAIFFTMRRIRAKRASLFVVSAFPLDEGKAAPSATGYMRFNVALKKILSGQHPKFPVR